MTREAESALQREILATGALVEQLRQTRAETFTMMARLIADAPKLKAAVDTNDPATVQNVANEYPGPAQVEPAARHQPLGRAAGGGRRVAGDGADRRASALGSGRDRRPREFQPPRRSPTACCSS